MRILYMGTPEFAVEPLRALYASGEEIAAVVTQTDKPSGRGHRMTPPPVKVYAEARGIPVYQPATLRDGSFQPVIEELAPELVVVSAYGKILPHGIIAYPKYGCINIHGSLLPEYRGAAPIQRALIDGRRTTGITSMLMDDGFDTGDMLIRREVPIGPDEDFGSLCARMAEAGAMVVIETLEALKAGTLKRTPQSESDIAPTYAAKIVKEDCVMDFSLPAQKLHDLIRGLSPSPLARTSARGRLLKVVSSAVAGDGEPVKPGTAVRAGGDGITVACGAGGNGRLRLLSVIPEGRGCMSAADFVRGRGVSEGDVLGR